MAVIKLPNITARKAKLSDIKQILLLAHEFYKEFIGEEVGEFSFEYVGKIAATIISGKNSAVFLISNAENEAVGMFYVYTTTSYFNPDIMVTEAHHMFIKPEYRKTSAVKVMLKAIREWAKNKDTIWMRDKRTEESIRYKVYKKEEKWQTLSQQWPSRVG